MAKLSKHGSIRTKLAALVLASSLFALILASVGFGIYERASFRAGVAEELSTLAGTLGDNTAASLAFDDEKAARDMLGALRAERHILAAYLYDNHGNIFAEYRRADLDHGFRLTSLQSDGVYFGPSPSPWFATCRSTARKPVLSRSFPIWADSAQRCGNMPRLPAWFCCFPFLPLT